LSSFFSASFIPAKLALADGTVFDGISFGANGRTSGEVVFNTSLTGYQEIITDPSYSKQIITLTCPHIGNTGINIQDKESKKIHANGLIIRDLSIKVSNFRSNQNLSDYLKSENIIAISGIDTRKLTRRLREKGSQSGAIVTGHNINCSDVIDYANSFMGIKGVDLAKGVSTKNVYEWNESVWSLEKGFEIQKKNKFNIVVIDFGTKFNILRMLVQRNCKVIVLPAETNFKKILSYDPDGIFLSNGPGDPEPCNYAINTTRKLIEKKIPIFGICLGHQILAIASGAKTIKMKFGHHGANHPVKSLDTGEVFITSQNHGFTVDPNSLPDNCIVTHISLFDNSVQGFKRKDFPVFGFQGHPEASPGPKDIGNLFDKFIKIIEKNINAKKK
tara:strand:- start:309 stop:1472 length:1164 start_codon:yes stop_codon:yes gene_type:complete